MAVLGSVICADAAEAQARLRKAGATFVKAGKSGKLAYKHTSGLRFVIWEPMSGGRIKLTESTTCDC